MKEYKYIAKGSVHRGHIIRVMLFKRGKIFAVCQNCGIAFYGLRRCIRKI